MIESEQPLLTKLIWKIDHYHWKTWHRKIFLLENIFNLKQILCRKMH